MRCTDVQQLMVDIPLSVPIVADPFIHTSDATCVQDTDGFATDPSSPLTRCERRYPPSIKQTHEVKRYMSLELKYLPQL